MQQGDEHRPFEDPDSGLILGEPSPFQYVPPPLPSNKPLEDSGDEVNTKPIQLPEQSDVPGASKRPTEYFFRRHLRDALERLFVRSIGPRWYTPLVYSSLVLLVVPIAAMVMLGRIDLSFAWISIFVGLLLSWYPVGREVYRHYTRTVRLVRTERGGLNIFYGQPTSLFWGFTGSGNDDESFLEGSTETRKSVGLLNRFPFVGCGDIVIYGKVEGGRIDFRNVPHVNRLQQFLSSKG